MKATACAHPVQQLIKTVGPGHDTISLPFFDSISVCTAPLQSITTIQFQSTRDILINGTPPQPRILNRIDAVISHIRKLSGIRDEIRMVSRNTFPEPCGVEPLPSLIAAITVAATSAAGLDLSRKELSRIARRGSGLAPHSVMGCVSRWSAQLQESSSHCTVVAEDLNLGMMMALLPPLPQRNTIHQTMSSPLLEFRLQLIHSSLYEMEQALKAHDISRIGLLAEKESVLAHALSMNGDEALIPWSSPVLQVMAEIQALREEGISVYFNVDTGPALFINCHPEDRALIEERMRGLSIPMRQLEVGKGAHLLQDHLF
jgi:phosphomevalonate decarboxylase